MAPQGGVPLEALGAIVVGDGGRQAVLLHPGLALGYCRQYMWYMQYDAR